MNPCGGVSRSACTLAFIGTVTGKVMGVVQLLSEVVLEGGGLQMMVGLV